jgi:hypothetical protein
MEDVEALEKISSRLGDVALDPSLWPEIMEQICSAMAATRPDYAMFGTNSRTERSPTWRNNKLHQVPATSRTCKDQTAYDRDVGHRKDLTSVSCRRAA